MRTLIFLLGGGSLLAAGASSQDPAPTPEQAAELAFEVADYDGNGWISSEEAREALRLDSSGFFAYDVDKDARITSTEYTTRYLKQLTLRGSMPQPVPRATPVVSPLRDAEQLRNAYDKDADGRIDLTELKAFVEDYHLEGEPAVANLRKLDIDGSGGLELPEIGRLAKLLETFANSPTANLTAEPAGSVLELFGTPIERNTRTSIPEPPQVIGPVPSFDRLDLNRDGSIGVDDLDALQFPLVLPVRPQAVVAALDLDADGQLSRAELRASME